MKNITFIDFHAGKDEKKSQIKSHAQSARYRRERMLAAQQHKWRLGAYVGTPSPPTKAGTLSKIEEIKDENGESGGSGTSTSSSREEKLRPLLRKVRRKKIKQEHSARSSLTSTSPRRTLSPSPSFLAIPDSQRHLELVLSETSNWLQSTYYTSWDSRIQKDKLVFDFDNGVETLRDSFLLVSDLVSVQKHTAAFEALNGVLDTLPSLLRDPHPELLYCLTELGLGITMSAVPIIRKIVTDHIAGLATVVLGRHNPLTGLLKVLFTREFDEHATEIIFAGILRTMETTFGPRSFQTILQDYWRAQYYATKSRFDIGARLIDTISSNVGESHASLKLITEYEQCLQEQQRGSTSGSQARKLNTLMRLEDALGATSKTPPTYVESIEREPPGELSMPSLSLARYLLDKRMYALALQMYSSGASSIEPSEYVPSNWSRNTAIANKLVGIASTAFGVNDKMAIHTIVHDEGSPLARHLKPLGPAIISPRRDYPSSILRRASSESSEASPVLSLTDPVLARFLRSKI